MARKAYTDFDLNGNDRTVRKEMAGALATLASATNPDTSAFTLPVSGTITATPTGTQAVSAASGAVAAGAVAAGAYVAGSILDGANVTQGAKADAAWTSGDGTVIALLKAIHAQLVIIAANTDTP